MTRGEGFLFSLQKKEGVLVLLLCNEIGRGVLYK